MQIEVIPYYSTNQFDPKSSFWVKSTLPDTQEMIVTNGESWDEATQKHRQKLADRFKQPEPPMPFFIDL